MSEVVACPDCGRRYKVTAKIAGRRIRCKECGGGVTMPELEEDGLWWESVPPGGPPMPGRPARRKDPVSTTLDMVPESTRGRPRRKLPGWVSWVAVLGGMLMLMCGGVIISAVTVYQKFQGRIAGSGESVVEGLSLREARALHPTVLLVEEPSSQPYDEFTIPDAERVTFLSEGRELFGWFGKPEGEGPFPAVLHAHGGFALGASDFDDARPFLEAGYAVFVPAWRGENGNPGACEFVFGEVTDAEAALEYLASRPDVDANQLFATGHSVGGTLVMLLAETSDRLKGVMACGGCPDVQAATDFNGGNPFGVAYDDSNPIEGDLRSAARHVQDLQCPLVMSFGLADDQMYAMQAEVMVEKAEALGKSVRMEVIPGTDHFTAVKPAMVNAILFFDALRASP